MCCDNVFTIIKCDFIKIARKLQKFQHFSAINLNQKKSKNLKVVTFAKSAKSVQLPPSTQSLDCGDKKSKMMHVLSLC